MRELTNSKNTWVWLQHHTDAFKLIKHNICKCNTLQFFDPYKATYLEVNSSLIGIRYSLLQNLEEKENEQDQYLDIKPHVHKLPNLNHLKPVAFTSKSLSVTEHRFADNECELVAVLTGFKSFTTMLMVGPFM